jgi:cellulose synthase/poly-beta-1,6-N-acetylglucosamine synthase-like glycosyltransferase
MAHPTEHVGGGAAAAPEVAEVLRADTFLDNSTVIACPTRGMIHCIVVDAWNRLIKPANQKWSFLFCSGAEVGDAYNRMLEHILQHAQLGRYKFMLTLEDDNIPPPDAMVKLLKTLRDHPEFDAVSGLYRRKTDPYDPLLCGTPSRFAETGELEFGLRDPEEQIKAGELIEVNGIPMGCALWRMDLFREIDPPWYVTVNEHVKMNGKLMGGRNMTQDLAFCEKARRAGKRFAVNCAVRVGHMDLDSQTVIY